MILDSGLDPDSNYFIENWKKPVDYYRSGVPTCTVRRYTTNNLRFLPVLSSCESMTDISAL